jgi:integral membrane protein (TIGR01906 family)
MNKCPTPASILLAGLGGLVLFLCLVCVSVTITLNFRPLYYLDMKLLHISDASGYANDVIRKNYDVLIDYNNIWYTGSLNFPDFAMSESGRIHFEEVKKVFGVFEYGAFVLLPISIILIVLAKKKHIGSVFWAAGIFSIGIPAALGVLIAANWEWVFVTFHKMVFQNDYWLFDPYTDPIILVLPDEFFMHCAALILLFVVAGSIAFFATWKKESRKMKK